MWEYQRKLHLRCYVVLNSTLIKVLTTFKCYPHPHLCLWNSSAASLVSESVENELTWFSASKILNPTNISTLFQRCFNVVFKLIWCGDVAQRQIIVETTLCTSVLWMLPFSTTILTTLGNVKTTLRINDHLEKKR